MFPAHTCDKDGAASVRSFFFPHWASRDCPTTCSTVGSWCFGEQQDLHLLEPAGQEGGVLTCPMAE